MTEKPALANKSVEQGGAATMDPSPLKRWVTSKIMTRLANPKRQTALHQKAEQQRQKSGAGHVVEYFHDVSDPYSYLAVQILPQLAARYGVQLHCHLVTTPIDGNNSEPELAKALACEDAYQIAPAYDLSFPRRNVVLDQALLDQAKQILAAQSPDTFAACAQAVGKVLWEGGQAEALDELQLQYKAATLESTARKLAEGNRHRRGLHHYAGAMFYYGQEWYWGIDRLYHLENRLSQLGADKMSPLPKITQPPVVDAINPRGRAGKLTLEFYVSLRSPYTAICFDRVITMAQQCGVRLELKPVLPMVMRGVSLTRDKSFYILSDAAREARANNVVYGHCYDPIGNPARKAYSLYPWACEQGKGNDLIASFLRAAFVEGVNTNNDRGLAKVVRNAGLDWQQAQTRLLQPGWEQALEGNRLSMYAAGLWGVPSFRLLDENNEQLLALWGQDRLWRVAKSIREY